MATEIHFCTRSTGISIKEKVITERIREIINVQHTIVDDVNTKQLKRYGHVEWKDERMLPKRMLDGHRLGKEGIGRKVRRRKQAARDCG